MCRDLSTPCKIRTGHLLWGTEVVESAFGFPRACHDPGARPYGFPFSWMSGRFWAPTDLCFGNQTSGTNLQEHICWGTQKELQEGTSIGMEVYGGNEDSRVRTKQLTFLWKAKSARIRGGGLKLHPCTKQGRREGQGKSSYFIEIIISHWRTDKGNVPSNAVLQRRKAEPA